MEGKKAAAVHAANQVVEGMLVGIGTGTTVYYFIERLVERCREGLKIHAVSSSMASARLAQQGGIPLVDEGRFEVIDLTVDGADEIDPHGRMIKGGGGALLREKILASSSRAMTVIIDESKLVNKLGRHHLPVEILPFGSAATIHKMNASGFTGAIRHTSGGSPLITDNGNWIYDIAFPSLLQSPEREETLLINIPGVVETGFFFGYAQKIIVGKKNGSIEELSI